MQKKVLALAVAGLVSGAAFAQTNVTIYGVVDAGFVNSSGGRAAGLGQANYSGIDSGLWAGSRIGFKGEEGLGNGLKAIFTLEYYLAPDDNTTMGQTPSANAAGASTSNSRQSFVGLQHAKYGSLTLGRQYAYGYGAAARNDSFGGAAIGTNAVLNGAGKNTFVAGSAARLNNAVVYTSPNWSGFTAVAGYAYGEAGQGAGVNTGAGAQSQSTNGVFTTGLNYANGPLNLDIGFQQRADRGASYATAGAVAGTGALVAASTGVSYATGASGDSVNEWMIGGSYDFGVVKVFGTYQDQNDNNNKVTSATFTRGIDASNHMWSLGASVPVFGNGKVMVSYADLEWESSHAGGSTAWALGYTHALSKRTTLYTAYTHVSNDTRALQAAGVVASTRALGESNSTITAGISHAF